MSKRFIQPIWIWLFLFLLFAAACQPAPPLPVQYALTVAVSGQGSISLDPAGGSYLGGTVIAATAVPAAGWLFDHWEGGATGTANPASIAMDAAKTVTAVFTAVPDPASPLQILLPLYSYPNWYAPELYLWDDVAAAAGGVAITAIVNPNSGPDGGPPNSDYQHGLEELRAANVTILGYVYTSYGARDIAVVKADVDLYDLHFGIDGIFFDEVDGGAENLAYYRDLTQYAIARPNLDRVFLNPGTRIDESFLNGCEGAVFVIFENGPDPWLAYEPDAYVAVSPAERFGMLVHSATASAPLESMLRLAMERNISFVYLTDDGAPNPWDTLPSFWQTEIDLIAGMYAAP